MSESFYTTLASWYPLLDPREDHVQECREFVRVLRGHLGQGPATLLELGAGAGNNASAMKGDFRCTLTDLSPAMLALSQAANPECEHIVGDMRDLRLGRYFDAVLVHDALAHLTSRGDLEAALRTAFEHTRQGGVALFVPDCLAETFREWTDAAEHSDGPRALSYVVRAWDPDVHDDTFLSDYACLLRDEAGVRAVHIRHEEGLFTEAVRLAQLREVGFVPGRRLGAPRAWPA